ncbi:MAG: SDR family oxidoreductase [Bacteroidota bacterium]
MPNSALILGATSDIAMAVASRFAEEGFDILLAGRKEGALKAIANDIHIRHGVTTSYHLFDALTYDTHADWVDSLGEIPTVCCCVFGLLGDQEKAEKDWSHAKEIMEVNYLGATSILSHIANKMEARGEGQIIGVSSVAGDRGRGSNYFYGSAKAGFTAFLSGLRNRLAKKGIHVLTVKPGFVDTAMTEGLDLPGPLTAQPEEVAQAIWKAHSKKKNVLYTKWMWKYIMLIIKLIPEAIFKKLSL